MSAEPHHLRDETIKRVQSAKCIHIVGVSGTEGAAIALWLTSLGITLTTHDFAADERRLREAFDTTHYGLPTTKRVTIWKGLLSLAKDFRIGKAYLEGIEEADLIFVTQNWEAYAQNTSLTPIFAAHPDRFMTITQLYFALFPGRIIAVTGSNGKSTTTKMIADVMDASRHTAYLTGNDRRSEQILYGAAKWKETNWLVVEVSNRQLKWHLPRSPDIGVVTNVTQNHLDEYGNSFAKYKSGKYSLMRGQTPSDIAVLSADNPATMAFAKKVKSKPYLFSIKKSIGEGAYVADGWLVYTDEGKKTRVLPLDTLRVIGRHNVSNALAAIIATRHAGVSWSVIRDTLKNFRGMPGRTELIAKDEKQAKWYDDTSSTTPESTIAAIESFAEGSVHLIAGGHPKGTNLRPLAVAIKKYRVRSVTLIASPAAELLADECARLHVASTTVATLREAVAHVGGLTKEGESVILSPAAAWFVWFRGRVAGDGKDFAACVARIAKKR